MTKSTTTRSFPVALKSIYDDIMKSNPNATCNPKSMRVKLRVARRDDHDRNAAWAANNQREYDAIRSLFDAPYAASLTKPTRKPRAKKPTVAATPATTDAE